MSEPFFSVIVPLHNAAEYVRKGIESIVNQNFTDYELIAVCDSCTDKTADIVSEYLRRGIDTLGFVHYEREGMTRNAGLDVARGKWILFMDDDDWFLPGAFQAIYDALKDDPQIDILAFGFGWKDKEPVIQSSRRILPAVWNKAWRRSFIGQERFPDWKLVADLGFTRVMHPKARFGFLPIILYYYNFLRPGSLSERLKSGKYDIDSLPESYRNDVINYEGYLNHRR